MGCVTRFQFLVGAGTFLFHHIQTGSGAHPASCLVSSRYEAAGALN